MRYTTGRGRGSEPECDHCGGPHENVPTVNHDRAGGELVADCPHCGAERPLNATDPDDVERHPATPEDEPITMLCQECNGSFYVRV